MMLPYLLYHFKRFGIKKPRFLSPADKFPPHGESLFQALLKSPAPDIFMVP
jgi:hypothetical protein